MLLPDPEHFAATLDMVCYSPAGWNKRFSVRNAGMDAHVSIIGYAVDCITVEVLVVPFVPEPVRGPSPGS